MLTTKTILFLQGLYYLLTALWPLVHMRSFEKVTGPKNDHWLVYTVAAMVLCSAVVLLSAAIGQFMLSKEAIVLALGNILALSAVDLVFSLRGVISKVYLLDAAVEIILGAMIISSL